MGKKKERPTHTYQMPLEEAIGPDSYQKIWGGRSPEPLPEDYVTDPEADLAELHHIAQDRHVRPPNDLTREDARNARKAWKQQLAEWGVPTNAEKAQMLRGSARETVEFLQQLGVWDAIVGDRWDAETIAMLEEALGQPRSLRRDGTSSEAVTIYSSPAAQAWDATHEPKKRRR